jgi:hypothetical protein
MNIAFSIAEALPPELSARLREILNDVRVAPPPEKLAAFRRAAARTAREIVGPYYPLRDAVDRLWTTAEVHGLVEEFGENIIQSELAVAFGKSAQHEQSDDLDAIALDPVSTTAPVVSAIELDRFLQMEIPRRTMLLAPWLPEQGLAMVHAFRGIGKTELILGIGYAIATGTGFLRWKAERPRRTLLIDGEMPAVALQARLRRVVRAAGDALLGPGFFRIAASDLHRNGLPDLSNPTGQQFYADVVADADLIIMDNLSTLCSGYKENDADTWGPIQAWGLAMRRNGRSCLFVHHDGKSGQQRGTSRKKDVLDTVIGLKRPPGYSADQGARFEVHFEKNRGFHGPDAEPFQARRIGDQWELSPIETGDNVEVIRELHKQGLSVRDIADRTGLSKSTVQRRLEADE